MTELKRALDVENVRGKNVIEPDATESNYRVFLSLDDATPEEIASLQVKIVETNTDDVQTEKTGKVESDLTVKHTLPAEHKVRQIDVIVYPEGKEQKHAKAITYARPLKEREVTNIRIDDHESTYVPESDSLTDYIALRADASLEQGESVQTKLHVLDGTNTVVATVTRTSTVKESKIEEIYNLDELFEINNIDESEVHTFKGEVSWQK